MNTWENACRGKKFLPCLLIASQPISYETTPLVNANYKPCCSEFGRPVLSGFFRTLTIDLPLGKDTSEVRGYHKPILIAGGFGTVRPQFALKDPALVPSGSIIVVLGGPSMMIGLGGGSASSAASAEGSADLVCLSLAAVLIEGSAIMLLLLQNNTVLDILILLKP